MAINVSFEFNYVDDIWFNVAYLTTYIKSSEVSLICIAKTHKFSGLMSL